MGHEPHAPARPPPLSSPGLPLSLATAPADDDALALEPAGPLRTRRPAHSSVGTFFAICSWLHLEWKRTHWEGTTEVVPSGGFVVWSSGFSLLGCSAA